MASDLTKELYAKLNQMDRDHTGTDWAGLKRRKFALVEEYKEFPETYEAGLYWVRFQ